MWTRSGFKNESDVEQKLVYRLLTETQGLGFPEHDVLTKAYLRKVTIGKRASASGFYPDYLLYASALPCVVVEAKPPSDTLEEAYRECREYAHEINYGFPRKINPIRSFLATNGKDIAWGDLESRESVRCFKVQDCLPGSLCLDELRKSIAADVVIKSCVALQSSLAKKGWFSPLSSLGGRPLARQKLGANKFARDLQPLILDFLAKGATRDTAEIINRAYVKSNERTRFEQTLESFLRDNWSRRKFAGSHPINTSSKSDNNEAAVLPARGLATAESTVTMVIGSVGSGKSIFIDRLIDRSVNNKAISGRIWLLLDFNHAPPSPHEFQDWIHLQVKTWFETRARGFGLNPDSFEELKKLFGNQVERERSLYIGGEGGSSEQEFSAFIRGKMGQWRDNNEQYAQAVFEYLAGSQQKRFAVVFDNCDKREADVQIRAFEEATAFISNHPCDAIIVMRDATYELFGDTPPLDTVAQPRIFRIEPPRLADVLTKRLTLLIEHLEDHLPDRLAYMLPNGVQVEYPREDLKKYVLDVRDDIFSGSGRAKGVLEGLAGRNIRRALDMFATVLSSPYLDSDQLGVTRTGRHPIADWQIVRSLMRRDRRFYDADSDGRYVADIFRVDDESKLASNFTLSKLMGVLIRDRKKPGGLGIEGYVKIEDLLAEPELCSCDPDDLLWCVRFAAKESLIEFEGDVERGGWAAGSFVKASSAGYVHFEMLSTSIEYLENIAMSARLRNREISNEIASSLDARNERGHDANSQRRKRRKAFCRYLNEEYLLQCSLSVAPQAPDDGPFKLAESLAEICRLDGVPWTNPTPAVPTKLKPTEVPAALAQTANQSRSKKTKRAKPQASDLDELQGSLFDDRS